MMHVLYAIRFSDGSYASPVSCAYSVLHIHQAKLFPSLEAAQNALNFHGKCWEARSPKPALLVVSVAP